MEELTSDPTQTLRPYGLYDASGPSAVRFCHRRRIAQQTFIDTYAKVACAKFYDRKTPITAADLLNDRVIPFFDSEAYSIRLASRPVLVSIR